MPTKYESFIISEGSYSFEEGFEFETNTSNYLKIKIFIPIIDRIVMELKNRFKENDDVLKRISCLNPTNKENFLDYSILKKMAIHYSCDAEVLESEIKILRKSILNFEKENNIEVKNIFQLLSFLDIAFAEIHKLVLIAVVVPVACI